MASGSEVAQRFGTNLKAARGMQHMHEDMMGSAVALGLLVSLTRLGVPWSVDCWLAITENRLSPAAYKPQDVVTASDGTTIEIIHTDAEGRMVLADTLALAVREHPGLVIDFATLTGACVNAITERYSGAFTNRVEGFDQLWLMERDGSNPRMIYGLGGIAVVAPTWSPDSNQLLFAVGKDLARQLFVMDIHGHEPRLLSDQIFTPGRTDWSRQGQIAYFVGETWKREVWTIYPDGTGRAQVTEGGNAQSPSFSPGGRHITYTAYTNVEGRDQFSCEIFIMDLYTRESRQLTTNEYCDYQPRWGN